MGPTYLKITFSRLQKADPPLRGWNGFAIDKISYDVESTLNDCGGVRVNAPDLCHHRVQIFRADACHLPFELCNVRYQDVKVYDQSALGLHRAIMKRRAK